MKITKICGHPQQNTLIFKSTSSDGLQSVLIDNVQIFRESDSEGLNYLVNSGFDQNKDGVYVGWKGSNAAIDIADNYNIASEEWRGNMVCALGGGANSGLGQ